MHEYQEVRYRDGNMQLKQGIKRRYRYPYIYYFGVKLIQLVKKCRAVKKKGRIIHGSNAYMPHNDTILVV